jgi:hypothetical protein
MDPHRFDRLSRQIGRQADRRTIFRTAAGGALALLGVGAAQQRAAANGREGSSCFANDDCETGLICEGAGLSFLGQLIAAGYGPPSAAPLVGARAGTCRYRSGDNCARSGQFCRSDNDCCNGLNLVCRGSECERRS